MPPAPETRTPRAGLAAAAALALIFAAVIGYFVWTGAGPAPRLAPPPDVDTTRPLLGATDNPNQPEVGPSAGADIQIVDQSDPTRVAARLKSRATEPLPEHRYDMTEPQAWVYSRDGRTVHIRADRARVFQPQRGQSPESGTLTGNVVVSVFEPRPDGGTPEVGVDAPVLTATTETLSFDLNLGEVSTSDRVLVKGEQFEFAGSGIKALFNEVKERVELVRIEHGEYAKYTGPTPRSDATAAARRPAVIPAAFRAQPVREEPTPKTEPAPTFYHLTFNDQVAVKQLEREFNADRLQLWARLVDGRLPEGAIAPIRTEERNSPPRPPQPGPREGQPSAPSPTPAPQRDKGRPARAPASDPVVMTWAGPCELRPLESAPAELAENDVVLRATANESGLVTFLAPDRDAAGHCATLEYGFTSRVLVLAGVGPSSVTLTAGGSGSFELVRATVDLAAGLVHFDGPGLGKDLSGLGRQLSWTKQGDLVLHMADGRLTSMLQEAVFVGAVQAGNEESSVRAETLRAELVPGVDGKSALRRVHAEDPDQVVARSRDGTLKARVIDLELDPASDPESPSPTLVTAVGDVEGENRGSTLRGGFLEARLSRGAAGQIEVTAATVRESVQFAQGGMTAGAEELTADPVKQIVDLVGPGAFVTREGTRLAAPQIHLDGAARKVHAFGAWTFEHTEGRRPAPEPAVRVTGAKAMTFDDATGIGECAGQVEAVNRPDHLSTERLTAERVRLELTPRAVGEPDEGRRLVRVTAIGSVEELEGGENAKAEMRRYVIDPSVEGGRRLERLAYLEGPTIIASQTEGTLDIAKAGRLLLVDQRPGKADQPARGPAAASGLAAIGGGARGDALFDWDGRMRLDRASGLIQMRENVRLTHRPLESGETVNLVCELLSAAFNEKDGSAGADGSDLELVSATAQGAVYVASGKPGEGPSKELAADRAFYDAARGVLTATAEEGNTVTLFDAARSAPLTASTLEWDLRTDQVRITKPGPVVVPR